MKKLFVLFLLISSTLILGGCYSTDGYYSKKNIQIKNVVLFELTVAHVDNPQEKFIGSSTVSNEYAYNEAFDKCYKKFPNKKEGCLRYMTLATYQDGDKNSRVVWDTSLQTYYSSYKKNQQLENKTKIANEKKKKDEEKQKAEARKKKENEEKKIAEEKKRIADTKKKKEEEERKKKEEENKLYIIGSGTGFFVSAQGHIVSNDHVVGICRKVASEINGELKYFNVLKTDQVNDLGLIKGDYKSPSYLSIKSDGAEFGEDIIAFGYPLADDLSTSVKLTRGIVSSLSGPGNNYSEIQIDAAIQPGNSGGPVMNMDGQVVGVASSGLNKLYMLEKSEYIPENVNFAVASPTLANFLKANGVSIKNQKIKVENTKELAKIGRPSTLQLFCMNTKAVFDELKEKKKHSDVLFEKVMDIK